MIENNDGGYKKADKPTIYFIGITTGNSSIMQVFPAWAEYLALGDCTIKGVDLKQHDDPEAYRKIVRHIKQDELSLGALVTTHKIDILNACRDLFDELCPHVLSGGELSCISKSNGKLIGHAKDPFTSGLALEAFLPEDYWKTTNAEVFVIGAGGSAIAICDYLLSEKREANVPAKIVIANRSTPRLKIIQEINAKLGSSVPLEYHHTPGPEDSDRILSGLKTHSLVINATGLGKDNPGSPITDKGVFPQNGMAWDFNYRGNLVFLDQARAQQKQRNLLIEDGWIYFIHGWTQVIAEVFHIEIPEKGPKFVALTTIAEKISNKQVTPLC